MPSRTCSIFLFRLYPRPLNSGPKVSKLDSIACSALSLLVLQVVVDSAAICPPPGQTGGCSLGAAASSGLCVCVCVCEEHVALHCEVPSWCRSRLAMRREDGTSAGLRLSSHPHPSPASANVRGGHYPDTAPKAESQNLSVGHRPLPPTSLKTLSLTFHSLTPFVCYFFRTTLGCCWLEWRENPQQYKEQGWEDASSRRPGEAGFPGGGRGQ